MKVKSVTLTGGLRLLAPALLLMPLTCALAAERPVLEARLTEQPPVLDGRLNDACWQTAPALSHFTQVLPIEGAPPSERTEVRLVFTHEALFIGIRCFESDPHGIYGKQLQRDSDFDSDDYVTLAFDTFARERDGYAFSVNPAGARRDSLFGKFSGNNVNWDTLWDARARVDAEGWTAEISIPFTSLSFDPRGEAWRWNVQRVIRRKQETMRWTALSRSKFVTALEDFGELRGLHDLRQGFGLEARPYVRGAYTEDAVTGQQDFDLKGGFDVTYRITPTLTALATYNTDFAESEVDNRVISLSRFPSFFPEKRDFFLQDAPLFTFGGLPADASPYYSRRIGLGIDGKPTEILGGGRLTGRAGGTSIALLDVYQEAHAGIEAKNLAVARVAQQVLAESSIGGIFTQGDPRSNGDAWVGGLDFNYQNSHLLNDKMLTANGWFMFSDSDRAGGSDTAFGLDVDYPSEPLDLNLVFRQWGEQFNPALGFIKRQGIRDYLGSIRYVWRPNTRLLRSIKLGARPFYTTDLNNRVVAENHDVPIITFSTPAGDSLTLETTYLRDVVDKAFAIWPGVTIPPGDYGFWQFRPSFRTSASRPLGVGFSFRHGNFYGGQQTIYRPTIEWRPSRHVSVETTYELREVRLPEGDFDVQLASLRLDLALTPNLTWSNVAQYDNKSDDVGLNSRIRWTWRPGSDVFLVWNQGWEYDDARFAPLVSDITLKIGATLRL